MGIPLRPYMNRTFLTLGLLRWRVDQAKLHGSSSGNLLIAGDGRC